MRAAGPAFAYTSMSMTARGGATKSWWWLAGLLAGCVQHRDQQPGGTFGHSRSDLFTDPVAESEQPAEQPAVAPEPTSKPQPAAVPDDRQAEPKEAALSRSTSAQPLPTPAAAPIKAAPAPGRSERQLRNAFANADKLHVGQAALDLAGYLVQQERHFEALFVVDAGLKRHRSVPLRLARAGLLRDLAQCEAAATELQGVVRELGAAKVSPATLFDLCQAEWVAGQSDAAASTLRSIQQMHAGDPWLRDHAIDMAAWDDRIRNVSPGRDPLANGELRDLFALLRAAPEASARLKMLDTLAVPPKPRPGAQEVADKAASERRRPVRVRAIAIACADESTAVRARAVHLAALNRLTDESFWEVALTDPAPLVRRFATVGSLQQYGKQAVPTLFAAIAREHDPATFEALHAALASALELDLPACTANTEVGRKQAVAAWRSQCEL